MNPNVEPEILAGPEAHLYHQVAERIVHLIEQGTLRPGERIPSVRRLSQQQGVSISTVLQAYRGLESRGWIEARPQSGYFVRARSWVAPEEPQMSRAMTRATHVKVSDLVMKVMQATQDPQLLRLGAALPSPDLMPTRALNRALASVARRSPGIGISYDIPPGNKSLRVQVARRSLEAGCTFSPDDIITTCGAMEALNLCLRAVASPGDTIAIESPTYFGILQCIEALGMKALEIPTHPRDGVSLEALEYALEHHSIRACLFIPNFHNPLGSCMPDENKRRLVELLAAREIPLIEDDIYGDLAFGPVRPKAVKAFDEKGLVLLCSSFSKTLAPGYRVGWVAPGRFRAQVEYLKMVSTLATATLPQMAIADFLANGGYDHHLRKVRRVYAEKVQQMTQAICHYFPPETKVTRPAGGHVLWVELPAGLDSLLLYERALAARIGIAPGPMFSAKKKYGNFIRLNCGNPWSEAMEQALVRLGQMVKEMRDER